MPSRVRLWIGAAWRIALAVLLLAAGGPGDADETQQTQRVATIRALQEQHHALPDSAALADALVDFLARRAFLSLATGDGRWNARNPRWQTLFPQFRGEFGEAVARMVPAYELDSTMEPGRRLNKVLASFSAKQLEEIETALGDPRLLRAVVSAQQASPLALRMMSANLLPQPYSEQELREMSLEAEAKFGIDPASPDAQEVVERLEQPTLKAYRERVMAALTDGSALRARLDSPALRAEFDALTHRWRSSVIDR